MILPYLRFSRDKRGYEHTFVIHSDRRRGRTRTRVLYWFRTPPGVRIGRSALDAAAIRCIEATNPDVEFDWTKILKGQGAPEPVPMAPPPARRVEPERRGARRPGEIRPLAAVVEAPARAALAPRGLPPPRPEPASAPPPALDPDPASRAGDRAPDFTPPADGPVTAAHDRLGSEGLLRLRARYAEMLARISERVPEPVRQEELKSDAERLNPDTWVTDAEVTAGLEAYEAVLESLRGVVGQGRRRRRRGGQGRENEPEEPADAAAAVPGAPAAGSYAPSTPD